MLKVQFNSKMMQLCSWKTNSFCRSNEESRQLTLVTGFTSLLVRLMLSPYSPLISEVVSNAEGPYMRTKNYDKDNNIVAEGNTQQGCFCKNIYYY
jgi:hypothetical protein